MTKLKQEFEQNIPDIIKKALSYCSKAADEAGIPIYLIGGVVRDIIINRKNFDIDITVQGNAVEFAYLLQDKYPALCRVKETHDAFKTAKIILDIDENPVDIDLASTRKESYPYPASLPVIEEIGCELYEDVIRRDFSINSMALSLNEGTFCELVDYLGGYDDLKQGVIRVLHLGSFVDDPTRIIRALKFRVRFDYKLSPNTKTFMRECLDSGRFDNLAGERVKLELKQAFNLNRAECLELFINEDIYRLVDTGIIIPGDFRKTAENAERVISQYSGYLTKKDNIWLVYLGLIQIRPETMEKLYTTLQEQEIVLNGVRLINQKGILEEVKTRFEVYEFFEKAPVESIIAFLTLNTGLKNKVDLYLQELRDIKLSINGNTLINLGLKPSPKFGKLLRETLKARINQDITTPEQEEEFVKSQAW